MGKVTFVLSDGVESDLRKVAERKGDLSAIADKAIAEYIQMLRRRDRLFDVEEGAQRRE